MLRRLAAPVGRFAGAAARWGPAKAATLFRAMGTQNMTRQLVSLYTSDSLPLSSAAEMQLDYESDQLVDEAKALNRESTLKIIISKLVSDFDEGSKVRLDRFYTRNASVISTGSLKLDLALGIGGFPKGRIVEIYGKEASGKTTLALHAIKEAQKKGGYCAYIDAENALNPTYADAIGVDSKKLLISQPDCAEHSLSILNTLVNSGSVDIVVVDSVAALSPKCEIDGKIDIDAYELQSQFMTRALNKIQASLCRSKTIVIFVNQVRANVKRSRFKADQSEVTCGGNALRFHSAVRLRISRQQLLHSGDTVSGVNIIVQIIKHKLAPASGKASLDIIFGRGIRREAEILEMATAQGFITRKEEGYVIKGRFFKDCLEAGEFLLKNRSAAEELFDNVRTVLFNGAG